MSTPLAGTLVSADRHYAIQAFLFREARLLDDEKFREWLGLLTDDIHYWLPIRENRFRNDRRPEPTPENSASVYNDRYEDLDHRVARFETGLAWIEDPPGSGSSPRLQRRSRVFRHRR